MKYENFAFYYVKWKILIISNERVLHFSQIFDYSDNIFKLLRKFHKKFL